MISLVRKRPTQSFIHPEFLFISLFAQIAQLVEQRTENPRVAGSIPALGMKEILKSGSLLFFVLTKDVFSFMVGDVQASPDRISLNVTVDKCF